MFFIYVFFAAFGAWILSLLVSGWIFDWSRVPQSEKARSAISSSAAIATAIVAAVMVLNWPSQLEPDLKESKIPTIKQTQVGILGKKEEILQWRQPSVEDARVGAAWCYLDVDKKWKPLQEPVIDNEPYDPR